MNGRKTNAHSVIVTVCMACWVSLAILSAAAQGQEILSSWNDGLARQAIVSFVKAVTDKSGPKYVEPEDRIATFDQDGTLWVEHPLYTQGMFALDRVAALAPQHPEWKNEEPFKAVIAGDREAMAKFTWTGASGGARLMMLVHHDDAEREYAYGPAGGLPDAKVGTFPDSLMAEAKKQGWTVISMKNDWKRIFAKEAVATAPATQGKADLQRLKGRWLRPDGGYVVEVRNVEDGGRMEASYFNPRSIHVSKAEASHDGGTTKVFIELRDVNYPGSTYTLTYDPRSDRLGGIYYQAGLRQSFEVVFVRMR